MTTGKTIARQWLGASVAIPGVAPTIAAVVDRLPGRIGDWSRFLFYDWLLRRVPDHLQRDQGRYWSTVGLVRWRKSAAIDYSDVLDTLGEILKPDDATLLELGCGSGDLLARIHERWPALRLTGVDAAEGMIARATATVPAAAFTCAYYGPPLVVDRADVVIVRSSLCYVPEDALRPVLGWMTQLATRVLVVSEPVFEGQRVDSSGREMPEVAPGVYRRPYDGSHVRDYGVYAELREAFTTCSYRREAHSGNGQWVYTR